MQSDGSMKEQGIRKRLGMKQEKKIYKNDFFEKEVEKRQNGISVAWFITFDCKVTNFLPAFAEAESIQEYYRLNGRLPQIN